MKSQEDANKRLEDELKRRHIELERLKKETEILNQQLMKKSNDLNNQLVYNSGLKNENKKRETEVKAQEDHINTLKSEIGSLEKFKDDMQKQLQKCSQEKLNTEKDRDVLKKEIVNLEFDIGLKRKKTEEDKKACEDLCRQRDVLKKKLLKEGDVVSKTKGMVKLQENTKKSLEQEIQIYRDEASKQRKIIYQLEKDRDQYSALWLKFKFKNILNLVFFI